jgi:hypothetical protein
VLIQMTAQLIHVHPVDSGCPLVADHSIQCCSHIAPLTDLLHQLAAVSRGFVLHFRSYARLSVTWGPGFTCPGRPAVQFSLIVLTFSAHRLVGPTSLSIYPRRFGEGTVQAFGTVRPYYAFC